MRIPLSTPPSNRTGEADKDALLTNVLQEKDEETTLAVVRPGLRQEAKTTGVGHGLVSFNDVLFSVYDASLGIPYTEVPAGYEIFDLPADINGATNQWDYIVVDDTRLIMSSYSGQFAITTNFTKWDISDVYTSGYPWPRNFFRKVWSGSYFVAVTDETTDLAYSADGVTWSFVPVTSKSYNLIASNGVGLVCVMAYGESVTTTDGLTYSAPGLLPKNRSYSWLRFVNGEFIAYSGTTDPTFGYHSYARSTDGVTWTELIIPYVAPINDLVYHEGLYVGTGLLGATVGFPDGFGAIYSPDLVDWYTSNAYGITENSVMAVLGDTIVSARVVTASVNRMTFSKDGYYWENWDFGDYLEIPSGITLRQYEVAMLGEKMLILRGSKLYVIHLGSKIAGVTTVQGNFFDFTQSTL